MIVRQESDHLPSSTSNRNQSRSTGVEFYGLDFLLFYLILYFRWRRKDLHDETVEQNPHRRSFAAKRLAQ